MIRKVIEYSFLMFCWYLLRRKRCSYLLSFKYLMLSVLSQSQSQFSKKLKMTPTPNTLLSYLPPPPPSQIPYLHWVNYKITNFFTEPTYLFKLSFLLSTIARPWKILVIIFKCLTFFLSTAGNPIHTQSDEKLIITMKIAKSIIKNLNVLKTVPSSSMILLTKQNWSFKPSELFQTSEKLKNTCDGGY